MIDNECGVCWTPVGWHAALIVERLTGTFEWRGAYESPIEVSLAIECDGKEFHSTEEQIQRDNRKNLAAKNAGIPLLRFSGSSIFRHAERCVDEILVALELL